MNAHAGSATISEKAGRWYVSMCVHEEQAKPTQATGEVIKPSNFGDPRIHDFAGE
jgi:hypothetical protein